MNKVILAKIYIVSFFISCFIVIPNPAHAGVAEDITALQAGEWYQIQGSMFLESGTAPNPLPPGVLGVRGIIDAWGGAVYDSIGKRLILWGGGHADYAGNELYTFDLNPLSPTAWTWQRIWGPTPNNQIPASGTISVYDDGNPSSRHTYFGLAFVPTRGSKGTFYGAGGAVWKQGFTSPLSWTFDLNTELWTQCESLTNATYGVVSVWDSNRNQVITRTADRIYLYDPVSGTHSQIFYDSMLSWSASSDSGFYDPQRDEVVYLNSNNTIDIYSVANNTYASNVETTGDTAIQLQGAGADFDSNNGHILAYDPRAGFATVYRWNGNSRSWTASTGTIASGSEAPASTVPSSGGTLGRWRYIPHLGAFVLVNSAGTDVYIYKSGTFQPDNQAPSAPSNLTIDGQ